MTIFGPQELNILRNVQGVKTISIGKEKMSNQSRAISLVKKAIRKGLLKKLDFNVKCVDCGFWASHYHHDDYLKPLEVKPLCVSCNRLRGRAKNHDKHQKHRKNNHLDFVLSTKVNGILYEKVRIEAFEKNITISSFLSKFLEEALNGKKSSKKWRTKKF